MPRNKNSDSYIKFIAVIDIIMKYSDEKHPMTVKEIQNKLYELDYDFQIDYRLIKKFVKNYNDYYDDTVIQSYKKGRNNYFYYANTSLDIMEAKAIVDLVYSSDFFTLTTKENYKKRIQDMFSIHYHSYFHKNLNLHIVKNENDQVFYNELELIVKAIQEKKRIRFEYQKPVIEENHIHKITELAPIDTVFSNNEYYLLCQGTKDSKECIPYRLDYIKNLEIVEESSVNFNPDELQSFHEKLQNMTYMYGKGQLEFIELEFNSAVYSNIIDKFGKKIHPYKINDNTYRVQVKHYINSTFYSWIIGFGGNIQIAGNEKQITKFKEFLTTHFLSYHQN